MMHELQDLEAKHPEMADPNSPTQRVGSDLNEEFRQVEHKYPMLSLANTYNEQDVADWYESVKKGLAGEDFEVCCEMKYDGLSISLTYVDGKSWFRLLLVAMECMATMLRLTLKPSAQYLWY